MGAVLSGLLRLGEKWIDWMRNRPVGVTLIKWGCVLVGFVVGGWALTGRVSFDGGQLAVEVGEGDLPTPVLVLVLMMATILVVGGVGSLCLDALRERRRRVLVVEVRGLRDWMGTPLVKAVPQVIKGQRVVVLVDLRQKVKDGVIVEPGVALEKLETMAGQVRLLEEGASAGETTIVYGGLSPVPFTFLTGMVLDDEGEVVVLDWDRHDSRWRELNEPDDGARFEETGVDSVYEGADEVALVVSVSYRIGVLAVRCTVPALPVVELRLQPGGSETHWSAAKQQGLGKQFLQTVMRLGDLDVKRLHLFLAAPNSVVFRFGRLYDRRNLPEVIVYQYEQRQKPPYPWGVRMPASGETGGVLCRPNPLG